MRLLSARLIAALVVGVVVVSLCSSGYEVLAGQREMRRDLQRRAALLAESLAGNVEREVDKGALQTLARTVQRFANRENLVGLAVYNRQATAIAVTRELAPPLQDPPGVVLQTLHGDREADVFGHLGKEPVHFCSIPLHYQDKFIGALLVIHDSAYIRHEGVRVWRETFLSALVYVVLIACVTLLIVRWSIEGPISRTTHWMRALRTGRMPSSHIGVPDLELFRPLAREVATFAETLNTARTVAEREARLRVAGQSSWTAERLASDVRSRLGYGRLFVISNREPYVHSRRGKAIKVEVPASGLVTALEPVLRTCGGTWIAHGSGTADKEVVDTDSRVGVPADDPQYTLRRVWLTKAEEEGYYYGFANEGLWPLCHIAHTRPIFRESDWRQYEGVNRKFAEALLEEINHVDKPVVLVQDYHFALLPELIKHKRPDARVAIFWHIPWPNAEIFGICPWQRELVNGLLSADVIGFHLPAHSNNFLETVDRVVESRINWEQYKIERKDHTTDVRAYPIGVDIEETPSPERTVGDARLEMLRNLDVEALFIGVGVDRIDYTKGILEKLAGIERFLDLYPRYQGQFTFVQIAAPSRSHLKRYHDLEAEIEAEAARINWRFQSGKWKPILLLSRQHNREEISRYFKAADLCLVASLHDAMNLVAKEFVAARNDESGVLVLSKFAGAAQELRDALLINPYNVSQIADAIRAALEMDPDEKQARMQQMRRVLRERNIYRWAAALIGEVCEVRLELDHATEKKTRTGTSAA